MASYERWLRPLLFRMDPEDAHNWAMRAVAAGLVRARLVRDPRLEQTLFGVRFPNPLGLAAGFDKSAVAVDRWESLGFGFAEIGTLTPRPQPGNARPRLFRIPDERALINRLGFNNDGAVVAAERLRRARPHIPIGINLGKNKDTPAERAAEDYRLAFEALRGLGQYYVVNVSSPNTPGLRGLQERGPLGEIFSALRAIDSSAPLFVKVAPDLDEQGLSEVLETAVEHRLTGLIATNTTIRRDVIARDPGETGGLSGAPLRPLADDCLAFLARHAPREMVLIGVGGILDGDDVFRKLKLGARLTQLYTGWVYGGPETPARILLRLLELMDQEGIPSLRELGGTTAPPAAS